MADLTTANNLPSVTFGKTKYGVPTFKINGREFVVTSDGSTFSALDNKIVPVAYMDQLRKASAWLKAHNNNPWVQNQDGTFSTYGTDLKYRAYKGQNGGVEMRPFRTVVK